MTHRNCLALAAVLFSVTTTFGQDVPPRIDTSAKAKQAQADCAAKMGKPVEWTNSVGMTFRLIPPGEFIMGNGVDEDAPLRTVRITKPFYLGATEVTRRQYTDVTGKVESTFFPGDDQPINQIHWYDTQDFFGKLKKIDAEKDNAYRLPTEAEWEYAARAGSTTDFPTGDSEADLDAAGWYLANADSTTHPVGTKAPNAFGLFDMHGNLWEWCSDFYDVNAYRIHEDTDPTGPKLSTYQYRVVRGGAIYWPARAARNANRAYFQDSRTDKFLGFRVVLPIDSK